MFFIDSSIFCLQAEDNKCMFVLFIFKVVNLLFHEAVAGLHRRTGGAELFFASFKGWSNSFKSLGRVVAENTQTVADIKWDRKKERKKSPVNSPSCWWEYRSGFSPPLLLLCTLSPSFLWSAPSCLAAFSFYSLTLLHLSLSILSWSSLLPLPILHFSHFCLL